MRYGEKESKVVGVDLDEGSFVVLLVGFEGVGYGLALDTVG